MALRYWLSLILPALLVPYHGNTQNISATQVAAEVSRRTYQTVFSTDFRSRRELRRWDKRPTRRWATLVRDSSGNSVLRVRATASSRLLQETLPINEIAGRKIH